MALQNIHQFLINVVFGKLGFQKGAFFPFMETKTESVESVGNPNSRFLGPPGLDLRSSHPLREGEHKSRGFFFQCQREVMHSDSRKDMRTQTIEEASLKLPTQNRTGKPKIHKC